ncbi:MAG: lipopolysaccharide heptosyltransferase II [Deltaproteobacteria bacterium]|nr:lipopolysaccharide heptosyltransferase II [Deltaproteobacteria bacterium]
MKILIVKLSSIGDVVHTLPCLYALRTSYPSAKIDWIVEEEAGNILIGHPFLNEVFVVKKNAWLKDFNKTYNIAKNIRALDYDIVLDFQGLLKSGIWVFLSNGRRRIGFDKSRELNYLFLNEKLPSCNPDKHAVDRYLDIIEYIGIQYDKVLFPIPISENEKKKVSGLLKTNAIWEGTPFIVANPMARWETKLWDTKKFADLCNEIMDRFSHKVVIIGASSGKEIKGVAALTGNRIIDLTDKTTLRELAYLMSLSKMVITVDSGPMHIAAAMGVPVIALFGPTAPWRTGPYGEKHAVIRKELPCSPCFSRVCKDKDVMCMKRIEVEDILKAVGTCLHKISGGLSELHLAT